MTQNYQNHRRFVPRYHFVLGTILIANVIWSGFWFLRTYSMDRLVSTLLGVGLLILFNDARGFALRVQDRVIRLEERIRLERLLPAELRPRIPELTIGQLTALRFAGDEELPGLTRRVLDQQITGRNEIKKLIQHWRPDEARA